MTPLVSDQQLSFGAQCSLTQPHGHRGGRPPEPVCILNQCHWHKRRPGVVPDAHRAHRPARTRPRARPHLSVVPRTETARGEASRRLT